MTASPEVYRTFATSNAMQQRLHELVPGGAHVQDVDGNWYVEYGMGLRSVTLGHAYAPVVEAVAEAARSGVNFSRPSVYELRAAEEFLRQVPIPC